MSGDDLTIALFLFGTAIAFGLTAVTLAAWTHRALVVSLFVAAVAMFVCALLWPSIGRYWTGLNTFLHELVANYYAFRAVILVILVMFIFDFIIKMRTIYANSPASSSNITPPRGSHDRLFVDTTPQYLMELYKDRLKIQGDKLAEQYIGKWIKVSGKVSNVYDNWVLMKEPDNFLKSTNIHFHNRWKERFHLLQTDQVITISGQITSIGLFDLNLDNCELVSNSDI
jgi:hypothetical protein